MRLTDWNPLPSALAAIRRDTAALGFAMACDDATGSLLRTLAAARPRGRVLELGTGVGTAWLLDGLDAAATLDTVERDAAVAAVAQRHLGGDPRVRFHVEDGETFLARTHAAYDLVFADTWPGKFWALEPALALVVRGGHYLIDDLLPVPAWPAGHAEKVDALLAALAARPDFVLTPMAWSTGLLLATRGSTRDLVSGRDRT